VGALVPNWWQLAHWVVPLRDWWAFESGPGEICARVGWLVKSNATAKNRKLCSNANRRALQTPHLTAGSQGTTVFSVLVLRCSSCGLGRTKITRGRGFWVGKPRNVSSMKMREPIPWLPGSFLHGIVKRNHKLWVSLRCGWREIDSQG
jgi:ribosomal protein L37E